MKRLRMSGLGLLVSAALLPACSMQDAPANQSISSTRPFASPHLLRLANYEQGSKTDIARQIGNAVPPDLAGAICKMVKATLETKPIVKPTRSKRKVTEAEIAETVSA